MISADGGGSNGYRVRLWKVELQKLADELKVPITVCHLPPGTSKWNKIEHRLFSLITINWRDKPLRSYRTIVQLIAATTTEAGLKVRAELDQNKYPKAVKVSDAQLAAVNLYRHSFHGDWNYTISPSRRKSPPPDKLTVLFVDRPLEPPLLLSPRFRLAAAVLLASRFLSLEVQSIHLKSASLPCFYLRWPSSVKLYAMARRNRSKNLELRQRAALAD